MRCPRICRGLCLLVAHLACQAQGKCPDSSLAINSRPVIYVVAASNQSEKFSRQLSLLSEHREITAALRLIVVPDTSSFLTMGWPVGIAIRMPDQRMRETITKCFGSIEGKHELLAVLIDRRGRTRTVSHDPITAERIRALLHP